MAYCSNCGAPLADGNRFCPKCGSPVGSQNADTNTNQNAGYRSAPDNGAYQRYQSSGSTAPNPGFRANIRKRDIAISIILSIVTCGIYGIIWYYNVINDLNTALPKSNDTAAGTVILLTIVTFGIYGIIWMYQAGEKVDQIKQIKGELPANSPVLYLILSIFGLAIVAQALLQSELNKIAIDA